MSNERLNRLQRHIVERIIIRGTLVLETPTGFGNGNAEGVTDLMLLRDSISPKALLTGASIAGALRNYLHEYEFGYGKAEREKSCSSDLFGARRNDETGEQSPLIIHDSISSPIPRVELRDGVKINSATGTAAEGAKYDLELLAAGTEFPLCFELLIERDRKKTEDEFIQDKQRLIQSLVIALQGLENHEITMGMKKRRGCGRCYVENWHLWRFNLQDEHDRLAWLLFDRECIENFQQGKIANLFQIKVGELDILDQRCRFSMQATFTLVGSLLIRSGQFSTKAVPDVVHLKSYRETSQQADKQESVLPGTSLAGVLRHRAERIVKTLGNNSQIIDSLFGKVDEENKEAVSSRLIVQESVINDVTELVQNRIAIDRFTGGAYSGALFDAQPIFGKDNTRVTLQLELRQPSEAEIGLLLLLLKDLWTMDLPVGGESSIGRGRLAGIQAEMKRYRPSKGEEMWEIRQTGNNLQVSDPKTLEAFVNHFVEAVRQ